MFPLLFARFELKFVGVSISGERYVASDIARERERGSDKYILRDVEDS